ncbi:MAG: hypothetical protein ACW99F_08310 [Candidatus Hodarchaeales archaeon]|jgi:hypothetical protein
MSIFRKFTDKLQGSKTIKTLYVLMGLTAVIGIISGIGSTCTTFDDRWWRISSFAIIEDFQMVFLATYFGTWLAALLWIVLYWALGAKKAWFYNVAIVNSLLGFFSGIIPVAILFYENWASYGESGMAFTPSWFRTIANFVMLIVLLLPKFRNEVSNHMAEKSVSGGSGGIGSQMAQFALLVFSFGVLLLIQPFIMPMTHPIDANVYMYIGNKFEALQIYLGLFSIALGLVMRFIGKLLTVFYSPRPSTVST